ncbi:efflux RND transporter permease subunit, partial [Mesorhizobium sp. M00.F.Ca.ET.149.01.1.1]
LGLDVGTLTQALQTQNALTPSGTVDAGPERIAIRVSGSFTSEESLKAINFYANGHYFRLGDVAEVKRAYSDPPQPMFRFNGKPAVGIAISMTSGGDALALGENVKEKMHEMEAELPLGAELGMVADQSHVVEESVGEFTKSLGEAIAIVLAVSLLALGWRPGVVVAVAIPLVLAITFVTMEYFGISLQRISLGALIIALGLLVDDAMIAVEMMISRMEEGYDKISAATYAYTSTAFPMLTGTLVTVAGFIPIGLNSSAAGEYTFTLFVVIAVSLLVSWIVAVLFAPLLGVTILPATMKEKHHDQPGRFTSLFRRVLVLSVRRHWLTIIVTVLLFAASIAGFGLVQQQFFPPSDRPELVVDWNLPQNASITDTRDQMGRFEQRALVGNPDIDHFSSYIGQGAVRFLLAYDVQPANPYFGQTVIVTKSIEARNRVKPALEKLLREEFVGTDAFVKPLELGPPVGRPVQYRVGGPDIQTVRELAQQFAGLISANPKLAAPAFDWNEPQRVLRVDVLQDKARQLGITSSDIASALNSTVGGATITQVRDATYLIDVVARSREADRSSI